MDIRIIKKRKLSKEELVEMAKEFYFEMIKGVAYVERGIIALGGKWYIDASGVLVRDGSGQQDLRVFNIYLDKLERDRLEYHSLINIKPNNGNKTTCIENKDVRIKIEEVINNPIE